MTLIEFVKEERERLEEFVTTWVKNNIKNPEDWPMEMNSGDWDEQYITFHTNIELFKGE